MERLRLLGAVGGAAFAVLVIAALAVAPGPSSADGVAVVEYYSAHGTAALWQAALVGFAFVCFVWFAGTFAGWMSAGPGVLVSAAAMAALYLAAVAGHPELTEQFDRDFTSTRALGTHALLCVLSVPAAAVGTGLGRDHLSRQHCWCRLS